MLPTLLWGNGFLLFVILFVEKGETPVDRNNMNTARGSRCHALRWHAAAIASVLFVSASARAQGWRTAAESLSADFTPRVAGQAQDTLFDSNGDSIPDAWLRLYRPGLNPLTPIDAQGTFVDMPASNSFDTAIALASYNADGNPARVFVTEKFVVVLEQYTHRIAVHDRAYPYDVITYYGAMAQNGAPSNHTNETYAASNAEGAFNQPFGMALDIFASDGTCRFAVADKGNNRVQLFSLDPDSGRVTFLAAYGTKTPDADLGNNAATDTLANPLAVAFMKGGDLIVSDSGNFRVLRLRTANNTLAYGAKYDFTRDSVIYGLCHGNDSAEGFWAADGGRQKQNVAFYHTDGFSSTPVVSLGTKDDKEFVSPRDVQLWEFGGRTHVFAADYAGSRIRVLDALSDATGGYTGLVAIADVCSYSDISLQNHEKVYLPNGVFPVAGANQIYVADYGHNKIKWFSIFLDSDGDGMSDIWEELNGLDPTRNDALEDADGDGLLNIGEYRAGTDPQNSDTDGDGMGDLAEMCNLRDPLDPDEDPWTAAAITDISVTDAAGTATNVFLVGSEAVITVRFDRALTGDGRIALYNAAGECVVDSALVTDGASATFAYVAASNAAGVVDAKFTFADCDPPVTNAAALFTVVLPDEPDPETEETRWAITSIVFDGSSAPTLRLAWNYPAEVAAGTECNFRVEYSVSITDPAWSTVKELSATAQEGCAAAIDLAADIANPAACFFRLWWTNRPKQ